jgi:hypothetical protein
VKKIALTMVAIATVGLAACTSETANNSAANGVETTNQADGDVANATDAANATNAANDSLNAVVTTGSDAADAIGNAASDAGNAVSNATK